MADEESKRKLSAYKSGVALCEAVKGIAESSKIIALASSLVDEVMWPCAGEE
jgi:hypothetical protein